MPEIRLLEIRRPGGSRSPGKRHTSRNLFIQLTCSYHIRAPPCNGNLLLSLCLELNKRRLSPTTGLKFRGSWGRTSREQISRVRISAHLVFLSPIPRGTSSAAVLNTWVWEKFAIFLTEIAVYLGNGAIWPLVAMER